MNKTELIKVYDALIKRLTDSDKKELKDKEKLSYLNKSDRVHAIELEARLIIIVEIINNKPQGKYNHD